MRLRYAHSAAVGAAGAILHSPLTFISGCEQGPPRISFHYTGLGRPVARDGSAPVEIFLAGQDPDRSYVVLGDIEIQARSRNTSLTTCSTTRGA